MDRKINKKFYRIFNSITSTIYEGIVKIGYETNTSMSIYYDLGLINYLLDSNYQTNEECFCALQEFMNEVNKTEELLVIKMAKQRFQFTMTALGIQMILSDYEKKPFLKDLVELVRTHHFTLQDVKDVFQKYDSDYKCEESDNEEFQYVFSFTNKDIDEYIYCFNMDDCYYHRLLPYDFEQL